MQPTDQQVIAVSEVLRKVLGYSLVRPARELLFTVVSTMGGWVRENGGKALVTCDCRAVQLAREALLTVVGDGRKGIEKKVALLYMLCLCRLAPSNLSQIVC